MDTPTLLKAGPLAGPDAPGPWLKQPTDVPANEYLTLGDFKLSTSYGNVITIKSDGTTTASSISVDDKTVSINIVGHAKIN